MDYNYKINPWVLFQGDDCSPKKTYENTINNRFPNYFRKSSSLVKCNFCNVILLKNQSQQHFKIHHNKKFKKKLSKFKIPFNAVEGYEFICEARRKKQSLSNISINSKNKELFKLKHKCSENNLTKQSSKSQSKLLKNSHIESKSINSEDRTFSKISNIPEKSIIKNNEIQQIKSVEEKKILRGIITERKNKTLFESKKISKRSNSTPSLVDHKNLKSADLKLNIRLNSEGLLTSSIKVDDENCSNIFDRISHFCDNSTDSKSYGTPMSRSRSGVIKQSCYDKSYGCTIFTDQFNNSIFIDNDKDEADDFDCCESSLSNDSAYFSLPNTTASSVTTSVSKTSNLCTASVAPPLVTAYQYSNSSNKVSYCTNGIQDKNQPQTTMHVTRSLSYNSIVPSKSTVKHRFYVSGHSNQTIVNNLKKTSNECTDFNFLIENENDKGIFDFQTNGVLHSLSKESQEFCYFNTNKSLSYQNQKHAVNSKTYMSSCKAMTNSRFWNCFEEKGLSMNMLIPKRLKWTQCKFRKKGINQLNVESNKQSPKGVHRQSLSMSTIPATVLENPLLTSYTIENNGNTIDEVLHNDSMLTSDVMLDYQFPDRNQMSFQQRLLERGVISQRDIARSQRCLSFNINTTSRKNNKTHPTKSNLLECKRIFANKNFAIKAQSLNRNGYNVPNSNQCAISQIKSAILQQPKIQSTSLMSQSGKTHSVPKHVLSRPNQEWCENVSLSRVQNQVSTFHEQCLSQNCKYIRSDTNVTVSPHQNRNSTISTTSRATDSRNNSVLFRSTSPNPSLIDSLDSYTSILTAQNTLPNDSNCYTQQIIDRNCINLSKSDINHHFSTSNNEFINYQQCYDEFNPASIALHPNYQTIFNQQTKYSNHSTNHYNANFEL